MVQHVQRVWQLVHGKLVHELKREQHNVRIRLGMLVPKQQTIELLRSTVNFKNKFESGGRFMRVGFIGVNLGFIRELPLILPFS